MLSGQTIPWLSSPYAASVGGLITFAPMPELHQPAALVRRRNMGVSSILVYAWSAFSANR
jgi:hypothetical protein